MPSLTVDTRYFWRVAGINSEGVSRWSGYRRFTTDVQVSVPFAKEEVSRLTLFPNPATREVEYIFDGDIDENLAEVSIFNILGEQKKIETVRFSKGTLQIDELPPGTYIVRFRSGLKESHQILQVAR